MEPVDFKKKKAQEKAWEHFPRRHLTLACSLFLCLVGLLALFPAKNESATRQSLPLELTLPPSANSIIDAIADKAEQADLDLPWRSLTVKSGDNLSLLFHRAGLNDRDVYEFVNSSKDAKTLTKLMPGRELAFQLDGDKRLQQLRYVKDRLSSTLFQRTADGFAAQELNRAPDVRLAYREATIDSNLTVAAKDKGMSDGTIDELANIFGWDIDFALDIRKGDTFKVLYEEKFLDGEKIGDGHILVAEFVNQGESVKAVRYEDEDGRAEYYTPEGKNMRKEFLRAPVDFRRISDGFNPRRLHPITKTIKPHRGIDYAADTGTPVWSSGDGKVIASAYSKYNGNYIVIQHGNNIQTKYLHLSKRLVKTGQRVRQKQIIGKVGATGLATGPHLHYEFLLNGVHRNPRTIIRTLPQAKSIAESEMQRFMLQTAPVIAQLDQLHQATQLALAESDTVIN